MNKTKNKHNSNFQRNSISPSKNILSKSPIKRKTPLKNKVNNKQNITTSYAKTGKGTNAKNKGIHLITFQEYKHVKIYILKV